MPSLQHEGIVLLFRENPSLAVHLLREALGVRVPKHTAARLASETVRQLEPIELAADAVVLLTRNERPVLAIVVEAQLGDVTKKRLSWPVYATVVRREHGCDTVVLVVAPTRRIARSADRPIVIGPGSVIRPLVIGPSRLPRIVDSNVACEHVELAVLSAMAFGRNDTKLQVVRPTLEALARAQLDEERRKTYADVVYAALGRAARAALEAHMKSGQYEYSSWFAKKYVAEGKAEGEAKALLSVLAARGLQVPEVVATRVRECRDLEQLERWVRRAAVATSIDEVFRDG